MTQTRQAFALDDVTATFIVAAHSDRGAVRALNEDSFLDVAPVFVVADGMGGHAFGDRASQAAIAAFTSVIDTSGPAEPRQVLAAITAANKAVLAQPGEAISGTTITGVAFVTVGPGDNPHWMAFNVGDSRVYSWDGRTLDQLTVDHSAVQELVDLGEITPAEAQVHPHRNVVTRALGAASEVDPDIWLLPARHGQTFLLCSDGLTKELSDVEIARIIVFHDSQSAARSGESAPDIAELLVNAAVAAGGSDNVTVVVVTSDLAGGASAAHDDDTIERGGRAGLLEDTRPRGT